MKYAWIALIIAIVVLNVCVDRGARRRDCHIPIVTQSQVARHYGGVFPPKEQDNAD